MVNIFKCKFESAQQIKCYCRNDTQEETRLEEIQSRIEIRPEAGREAMSEPEIKSRRGQRSELGPARLKRTKKIYKKRW